VQVFGTVQPGASYLNPAWKAILQMPVRSGRLEKRIRLVAPVEISSLLNLAVTERTTMENFCSLGIRILTQRARELNERLWVRLLDGDLRAFARVVYCQRLADGRFGVGLQFEGQAVNCSGGPLAGAAGG
jgi:hypothetical protein